jgi:hypothetical protein
MHVSHQGEGYGSTVAVTESAQGRAVRHVSARGRYRALLADPGHMSARGISSACRKRSAGAVNYHWTGCRWRRGGDCSRRNSMYSIEGRHLQTTDGHQRLLGFVPRAPSRRSKYALAGAPRNADDGPAETATEKKCDTASSKIVLSLPAAEPGQPPTIKALLFMDRSAAALEYHASTLSVSAVVAVNWACCEPPFSFQGPRVRLARSPANNAA